MMADQPQLQESRRSLGRVLTVASQKGGVGKTTTAVNLAASLAVLQHRVLLVDLDPQGAVGLCFGLARPDVKGGMFDVFVRGENIAQFIVPAGRIELGIVPANVWSDADEEAYMLAIQPEILVRAISVVRSLFDYIILDTPPTIGPLAVASLSASDAFLIPVQCEDLAVRTVGRLLRVARKVARERNPQLTIEGIALTMVEGKTPTTCRIIEAMRRSFGDMLFRSVILRSEELARAVAMGDPVVYSHPASNSAQAYMSLAAEITGRTRQGGAL